MNKPASPITLRIPGVFIADLKGLRFRAVNEPGDPRLKGSVLDNPLGRLRLVSMKEIAEGN